MKLNILCPGSLPYSEALDIQYKLHQKRQENEIDNTLLLLEHPPVLTLGTRGQYSNIYLSSDELKSRGIEVFEVNRGGDVTYHGPGQIVGYPIFDLKDIGRDIRLFIEKMEQSMIDLLNVEYGIRAYRETGKYTGVWVDNKKITAVGISVRKWVTMHGFAFNVNTDLTHFSWINPCGLSKDVTSLEQLTGEKQDMQKAFARVAGYFAKEFGCDAAEVELEDLL